MKTLKFKTILFSLVGIFLYISHVMLYREITADSPYPFFSALFFLLFLSFWAGAGILFSPFKRADKPYFLFPLLCISPATLLSLTAVQLFSACRPVSNFTDLALIAFLGCFPLGIILGTMLASAKLSVPAYLQKHVAFYAAAGYLLTGIIIYPLALFNVLADPVIYTFTANSFILLTALTAFKVKIVQPLRYWFLTFATILMAVNFSLLQVEKYATQNFFATRYPDWQLLKPYLTHYGKITLLRHRSSNDKQSRFMILQNNRIKQVIPDDCTMYKTTAIPFSLQPNKKDLDILAIGPRFSYVPIMLGTLPYVKSLTLVTGGEKIMPLTILRYFSPPPSPKVNVSDADISDYLKENRNKFDLIIWLFPNQYCPDFAASLKLCVSSLKKNGALAVPVSLMIANNSQNNCESIFKNKIILPGKSLVYAYSNAALTADVKVLEKRLDVLDDGETRMFPQGTFSIIYSIPHTSAPVIINPDNNRGKLIKSFASMQFNSRNMLIILVCGILYFIARFFILRRKSLHAAAGLFENGLCLMLLMTTLMALSARQGETFYYGFGIILTAISGIPMGFFLDRFKLRRPAVIMSVIVIFLSAAHWKYSLYFIPGIAYINFLCGGIIIANILKGHPDFNIRLLSIHFLACSLGAVIMFFLLITGFDLLVSLFIVILFRIPLVFSRISLGKLDMSGGTGC